MSFIFTGFRDSSSVKWNVNGPITGATILSNFNQKACTVSIEQTVEGAVLARGTLRLKDMTGARVQRRMLLNWNPQPYSVTFLEITSAGRIFDGSIRTNRDEPLEPGVKLT